MDPFNILHIMKIYMKFDAETVFLTNLLGFEFCHFPSYTIFGFMLHLMRN